MGLHPFKIYFKHGGGIVVLLHGAYLAAIEKNQKNITTKMKNGDEKWNSVLYDYKHMRYIHGDYSSWWLLEKIK